jgi:hypothetical protein
MRLRKWLLVGVLAAGAVAPAGPSALALREAAVSSGLCQRAVTWREAEDHIGQRRNVVGPVKSTFYARGSRGRPTFLNLGRAFPNPDRFTVVIWGRNRGRFPEPPEDLYRGEYICVRGLIRLFEGVPQTFANGPSDIKIRGS